MTVRPLGCDEKRGAHHDGTGQAKATLTAEQVSPEALEAGKFQLRWRIPNRHDVTAEDVSAIFAVSTITVGDGGLEIGPQLPFSVRAGQDAVSV